MENSLIKIEKKASKILLSLENKTQQRVLDKAYLNLKKLVSEYTNLGSYATVDIDKDYTGEITLRTSLCKSYAFKIDYKSKIKLS